MGAEGGTAAARDKDVARQQIDALTAISIGVIAVALVTADHEAFGHGGACLALGGHIRLLTSSIFHCDLRSGWIDGAGPFGNLVGGTIALLVSFFVPSRRAGLKLFLVAVTAFSFFWEGAYLADALLRQSGDLYFFAKFLLGAVAPWQRYLFAAIGVVFYIGTIRLTSRRLLALWPDAEAAQRAARALWLGATLAGTLAALFYKGEGIGDFKDAVLETSIASLPLLFIPRGPSRAGEGAALARDPVVIVLAVVILAVFTVTLGRGVGA
jgi:hypothetical protein